MSKALYKLPSASSAGPLWRRVRAHFIDLIKRGDLSPGDALPPHTQLCEQVGVGNETLQRALKELSRQGWLVRHPRRGTFVADPLPEARTKMIAVMTRPLFDPRLGSFDLLQARAVAEQLTRTEQDFRFYSNHLPADESVFEAEPDIVDQGLFDDVEAGRVDGLFVLGAIPPRAEAFRKLVRTRRLPVVQTSPRGQLGASVCFDMGRLFAQGGALLREQGCRDAALLRFGGNDQRDPVLSAARDEEATGGLSFTHVAVPEFSDETEAHHAIVRAWGEHGGFDGLLIADDVLAKGAATALLSLGARVPEDVYVVTHANRDSGIRYPLPMVKIEFDVDALIRTAWRLLEHAIQEGESPRGLTLLPPAEEPIHPDCAIDPVDDRDP